MADIYKTKEIETNINERGVNLGNVDVTLYTMDKGSAAFKIHLKREVNYGNEKVYDSVNLYTTDMTPRIDIVAADGSVFSNEPIDIVIPENGVIQYIVSDYVIRHAGKMDVYIYLENKSESVQVSNFYFYIEEDGVARRLGKEITGDRLDDIVKNVMSGQLMELLSEDFREQLDKEIKQFLSNNNKDFNLKFEDLTREEKDELTKDLTNKGLADFRIEDNSIFNEKLVDGTIQPEKTTFFDIKRSSNLLDINKVTYNKNIDSSGNIVDDSNRWISDYIPMTSNESISFTKGSFALALYDDDKNFISRVGISTSPYSPRSVSNLGFIRIISSSDLSNLMFNKGESLLPYEKAYGEIVKLKNSYYDTFDFKDGVVTTNKMKDDAVTADKIKNNSITPDKTTFITTTESKNLLDITAIQINKTIDTDGTIIEDSTRWLSDYIELDSALAEKLNITQGLYRLALYDKDKKFISRVGLTGTTQYTPNAATGVKYIRISGYMTNDYTKIMVNKGETLLPLEKPENNTKMNANVKVTPDSLIQYQKSNNIFNKNDVQFDKTLDINGNIVDAQNWVVTPKIAVEGKTVSFTQDMTVLWAVFDKNDNLISRSQKNNGATTTLDLSDNASYFVLSVVETTLDRFMANYGSTLLPYEDFGYTLVSTNEAPIRISEDIVPKGSGGVNVDAEDITIVELNNSKQIATEYKNNLPSNETASVYTKDGKVQFDSIIFSSDDTNAEIIITFTNDEGEQVNDKIIKPDDNTDLPLTIDNIATYGYPKAQFLLYNPKKNLYKLSLNGLNFSNNVQISVKNNHTSSINVSIQLVGRYYV